MIRNKNKQFGFSLIELLVVMVIIGILSGMGIAGFQSYQQKAKEAKIKTECAQFDRCALSRQTCINGGGTFSSCQNICDTSALSCNRILLGGDELVISPSDPAKIEFGNGWADRTTDAGQGWNNSGLVTTKALLAGEDGVLSWTMPRVTVDDYVIIGLAQESSFGGFNIIDYGVYFHVNGFVPVENTLLKILSRDRLPFDAQDKFQIKRTGDLIEYKRNGTTFYTSIISSSSDLYVHMDWNWGGHYTRPTPALRHYRVENVSITKIK